MSRSATKPAGFGMAGYELSPLNEDGTPATQAGSHPFQLTTTLVLEPDRGTPNPVALPKDLSFDLPPGLVGNPTRGRAVHDGGLLRVWSTKRTFARPTRRSGSRR